jgi:NYN domain
MEICRGLIAESVVNDQLFAAVKTGRVAMLVDGDNISCALAGQIIMRSLKYGQLLIRRVYGNAAKMPGWDAAPGYRLIHSGCGKNATDMLLSVEAMGLMLDRQADVLVVATSDGDFHHLASVLRERGFPVIGIGEGKAPEAFRKACTHFHEIGLPVLAQIVKQTQDAPKGDDCILDTALLKFLKKADMSLTECAKKLRADPNIAPLLPKSRLGRYICEHSKRFAVEGTGSEMRVRLKT